MPRRRTAATKLRDAAYGRRQRHVDRLEQWKALGGLSFPPLPRQPYPGLEVILSQYGLPAHLAQIPEDPQERRQFLARERYNWHQRQNNVPSRQSRKQRGTQDPSLMALRRQLMRNQK